jgi:hypothetical protein
MNEYGWDYRCSICQELINPDEVRIHTEKERAKETWPGFMSWERVDND